ncbi:UNVERIFIED_CONTAM: hypothetical protein FKN15_071388 [Acipenser sinensis]
MPMIRTTFGAQTMSEAEQDARTIAASWDGDCFEQQETEVQEVTQEIGHSFNPAAFTVVPGFSGGGTVFLVSVSKQSAGNTPGQHGRSPNGLPRWHPAIGTSELCLVSSTLLQISGFQGQALGRSLMDLVVARRQLWLAQARVPDADKSALLDAPISPGHTFGPVVEEILQCSNRECEESQQVAAILPYHTG